MVRGAAVIVFLSMSFSSAYAQASKSASGDADTIKQLERDWSEAQKTADVDKLGQILADDWIGLAYDGAMSTKKQALADVKSGTMKITSITMGPMDVKIIGNVAVVQGSDTEKSSLKGKDTSGKWVWMDVFVKQAGKWQAVRSQSAMVK